MAPKLDENPNAIYDSEPQNPTLGGPNDGSISPGEQAKLDQTEAGERDIAAGKESATSPSDGISSATSAGEKSFYKPKKNNKQKSRFSRRQKFGFGFGGAGIIGGVVVLSTLVSGPLQIMHFANLLSGFHFTASNSVTEGRLNSFYRYAKYPNSVEQRRIGFVARNSVNRVEATFRSKGLTPRYNSGGRLTHFDVRASDLPSLRAAGLDAQIRNMGGGNYRVEIDVPGRGAGKAAARANLKKVTNVVRSLDVKVGAIGARNLRAKAGIQFFDLSVRRAGQNIRAGFTERRADKRIEHDTKKQDQIKKNSTRAGEVRVTEVPDVNNPDGPRPTSESVDIGEGKAQARTRVDAAKRAAGGLALVGLVCAAYQIADTASVVRQANVILPLMRVGMRPLIIASQIQAGDVDIDEIGFFLEDLYDQDAPIGERSWVEAASIQTNLGNTPNGPTIPNSAHPANGGNFILKAFNSIPNVAATSIGAVCGVITSTAGRIVGYGVDLVSGGTTALIKSVLAELVIGEFADDIVSLLAGEEIDVTLLRGALGGAYADFGAKLAGEENMLSLGGRKLSPGEVAELNNRFQQEKLAEIKNKSVFERYFAYNQPDSLAFKFAVGSSSTLDAKRLPENLQKYAGGSPANLLQSFGSLFVNKAYAQTKATYDYNIQSYGFSVNELDNPIYDNPMENENVVSSYIQNYGDKIEKCFGKTLAPDNRLAPIPEAIRVVSNDRNNSGCDDTDEEWTRVRFYVLDEMTSASYACGNGSADYCKSISYNNSNDGVGTSAPRNDVSALNCTGYDRVSNQGNTITRRDYSDEIKQQCQELKQRCEAGNIQGTEKIVCEAFKYDGVFYGNFYSDAWTNGRVSNLYGFNQNVGQFGIHAEAWLNQRVDNGLNPRNLLECSGLTSLALYDAYGFDGNSIGCSGNYTQRNRPALFRQLDDSSEIRPGDFLTKTFSCNSAASGVGGHVAIAASGVDANGNIIVYETNAWGSPVRFTEKNLARDFPGGRSRYIGQGAE